MTFGTSNQSGDSEFPYILPQVPLQVEEYPVAPAPLELEQVHVFVRHGERTPVGVRLAGPPANIPEHWNMCKTARRFKWTFRDKECKSSQSKVVERKDGKAFEGECLLGELTDLGRHTTSNFGKNLRRLYVDRLGFLPDQLDKHDTVYFRTTNMPRTTESLKEIVGGLYPVAKCSPLPTPPIRVRNGRDENLIGNTYACKRLEFLLVGFAKAAADAYNPTLAHLDKRLSKFIDGKPVRVDGRPRASGILDTVRSAIAHGIKVPAGFEDKKDVGVIEKAVVNEWFGDKTEEVRRLGMGRLFDDMLTKMQHKINNRQKDSLKMLVHSTHDTTIAAIHQTLDVFDDKWPAFTASVTFELYKVPSEQGVLGYSQAVLARLGGKSATQRYIRMRSQNKSLSLPICAEVGNHLSGHPEFCTFEAFKKGMEYLIPRDWEKECSVKSEGSS